MKKENIKLIAYWITTVLGPTSFLIGGVLHLMRAQQPLVQLAHLEYPWYFIYIIGFWKLAGAIVITMPGVPLLKEWAYAGFFFLLTGAAASHIFVGDPFFRVEAPSQFFPPLLFLALTIASWALRPPSRRLKGA